jgi:hypothetical protein
VREVLGFTLNLAYPANRSTVFGYAALRYSRT